VRRSAWTYLATQRVSLGYDAAESVARSIALSARRRAFVVTSASVATSETVKRIVDELGDRYAGLTAGIRAHVPLADVLSAAEAAREAEADCVVAVGGGSAMDAAKVVALALRYGISDAAGLAPYAGFRRESMHPAGIDQWPVVAAVPTTLSAAEFTYWGGVFDPGTLTKVAYSHPYMGPRYIALDPAATVSTPRALFLSSGMKAVDHAVERLATIDIDPLSEAHAEKSLRMLATALRAVAADPAGLEARLDAQTGMAIGMASPATAVKVGASHALGHALGAHNDVPHGLTSCVLLPSVLRWCEETNPRRQAVILAAMGGREETAADAVARLVADLGLPGRLRDVGVEPAQFAAVAEKAFTDMAIVGSPRRPGSPGDLVEILEMAY
jgi:maleylacetate reductase